MKLDLFSEGDRVLLLGEGNFSFARSLYSLNLPISITATCFDNGVKYKSCVDNINYLMENNVPIFLDVDATNLHHHPKLRNQRFSKVIFNFPHVGGKMKIQLNRNLVKKVFESASKLLVNDDMLIMSLCNGQGGTPADNPQRKWDDSWQITEMAAYGNFCLTSVEPFNFSDFLSYNCTGYRSQDSNFNLKGALVHIFKKKDTPSRLINDNIALQRLSLVPLCEGSDTSVSFYYSELYSKNPLFNLKSAVSFLKQFLIENPGKDYLPNLEWKFLDDKDVSISFEETVGVPCKANGTDSKLRFSAIQILNQLAEHFANSCSLKEMMFFPGMFFNSSLGEDFNKTPPISFQFVLLGAKASSYFYEFMKCLISVFNRDNMKMHKSEILSESNQVYDKSIPGLQEIYRLIEEKHISSCKSASEWSCSDNNFITNTIVAHELLLEYYNLTLDAVIIYVDIVAELFFETHSWKEIWSWGNEVYIHSKSKSLRPVLSHGLLYPSSYKFDITLKYDSSKGLLENDVYEVLRISAVDLIREIEIINEYNSLEKWSSKCFRITYHSLNEPLNRHKALDIHNNLIGKMLTLALPVTIK